MHPDHRNKLRDRVVKAAEAALARNGYAAPVDVLTGIGWLPASTLEAWRQGRTPYLEEGVNANPSRISDAMKLFRAWASQKGLRPSETAYVARQPSRPALRFSKSGDSDVERNYRTHFVSPALDEKKRAKLIEKASRPPELVVIAPLNHDWTCHRCGKTGDLLMMENGGPACLRCVGLDDLEFLPAGDTSLTRKAKAKSTRRAVVVRFSRTRKRYERQGLLVETQALREASEVD
ncbi:MAG: hypothetical protein BroJett029_13780 [Alphaproteobacteria bacterium]|nr:MAG: hypothetical protein BroJett029_13780 [Alphaproteobacteria bacterium]